MVLVRSDRKYDGSGKKDDSSRRTIEWATLSIDIQPDRLLLHLAIAFDFTSRAEVDATVDYDRDDQARSRAARSRCLFCSEL